MPEKPRPGRRGSKDPGTDLLAQALEETASAARTLLYVHGIGNKPRPSVLKCQWDQALFGFDLGERSRLAYWVNRGYYPDPTPGTCHSGDVTQLEEEPTGRSINIRQHMTATSLEDEVKAVATNKTDQDVLLKIAAKMELHGVEPVKPTVAATGVEAEFLPFPRALREWITRKLTRAFLRDVNDFLFVEERRRQMEKSVSDRLQAQSGPYIVIGHSQGSMIAYDVLTRSDAEVLLFVTLGSPLGIQEVQDQLKHFSPQKTLQVPRCVRRWINVADPIDPVALDRSLSGEFQGKIEDIHVNNLDAPRSPHSGTGYLRTEVVRRAVRDAVDTALFQPVAPFVIARDVTRDLEDHPAETRHKLLIELGQASGSGGTLAGRREAVVTLLHEIAQREGVTAEELRIEQLRHFVAADLTRIEAEQLAAQGGVRLPDTNRVWRNSVKSALLDTSVNTVQASAAHAAYHALGRGIEWAVLDSGVVDHPHFTQHANLGPRLDCTARGAVRADDRAAADKHGHGTHVAGIIAGYQELDSRVLSGMAPAAKLHVYKVLDADGKGEDAWIIKALDHIAELNEGASELRIHGVNLSLGGSFDQSVFGCGHSPLCNELRRLWDQGVLVVIAAGNEGFAVLESMDGPIQANMDLSVGDPANLEEAIAVGSVHKERPHTYGVSYFSSRGPTADGRQKPDLVAPGERICSCRHRVSDRQHGLNDLYVEMSGTSMAAPHVSGILAAFLSVRREFIGEPDRVKRILLANCTDLGRDRPQQGAGMPNLMKMLVNT